MEEILYKRGDIIFVVNPLQEQHGHVICGNHPAVVIQNQRANESSPNLIIAYVTSQLKRVEFPTHVVIQWYDELKPSMILAEQLTTISKGDVLGYVTHLREEDMVRLDKALKASLELEV